MPQESTVFLYAKAISESTRSRWTKYYALYESLPEPLQICGIVLGVVFGISGGLYAAAWVVGFFMWLPWPDFSSW